MTTPLAVASGRRLTEEYLSWVAGHAVDPVELAGAAAASTVLAPAYRDRFLPAPVFLGAADRRSVTRDLATIHTLLTDLPQRLFDGDADAFAEAIGMTEVQRAVLARVPPGAVEQLSRSDLYRGADGFRLLEMNITSALGGFENARLNRAMLAHPVLSEFVAGHGLTFTDTFQAIVDIMRHTLGERFQPDTSVVALTDWPESFRSYEPRLKVFAGLLAEQGITAVPCHVGQLTQHRDGLAVDGRRVDVIYRFFLLEEIVTAADLALLEPVLAAEERGQVAVFSRMDAELYGNKGALALLSDDRTATVLSAAELECVRRFLPWSRFVRNSITDQDGASVDTLDHAVARQAELILKPVMLHGGSGVLPGWRTEPAHWAEAVAAAVDQPYVLQQRVRPLPELLPGAGGEVDELFMNWGVFHVDPVPTGTDGYGGCILRGSTEAEVGVVSMGGGAKVACCFHPAETGMGEPE